MDDKVNARTAGRLAILLWTFCLASLVVFFVFRALNQSDRESIYEHLFIVASFLGFATVGAIVANRQPNNPIGWVFLIIGLSPAVGAGAGGYATYALITRPDSLPGGIVAAWLSSFTWYLIFGPFVFLFLLFPTGKLLSPRWRLVAWTTAGAAVITVLSFALRPDLDFHGLLQNPVGITWAGKTLETLGDIGLATLPALWVVSGASMVLRFRRAKEQEKLQIKWFTYAVVLLVVGLLVSIIMEDVLGIVNSVFVAVLPLVPLAAGIAILKYRLYDINLVINRTLVYVPLTAILAGLYITAIGLFRTVLTEFTGKGSDAAVALTTLLVVVLVTPLRNHLQTLVDKYFKETQGPMKKLSAFTERARSVVQVWDAGQITHRFLDEAVAAFDMRGGAVYLRKNGRLQLDCTSQGWEEVAYITVPLEHQGKELGSATFGPRRNGLDYTQQDLDVLRQSASVVAHALTLAERSSR